MNLLSLSKRTVAYIVLKVSGTLGGGAVIGVEVWQAALLAGFIGFMEVAEEVSRAYVKDGDVTEADMNDIFNDFDEVEDMDSEA
jgi:hypothetical protein